MQFIVDTSTHRHAYGERRVVFSWASFYAGVGIALGMMLIACKALPPESRAARPQRASAVVAQPAQSTASEQAHHAVTASSLVLAIEAASPNASNRGASVALEHLRWRGAERVSNLDREYAALAVMELMGKTRPQAETIVGSWTTP